MGVPISPNQIRLWLQQAEARNLLIEIYQEIVGFPPDQRIGMCLPLRVDPEQIRVNRKIRRRLSHAFYDRELVAVAEQSFSLNGNQPGPGENPGTPEFPNLPPPIIPPTPESEKQLTAHWEGKAHRHSTAKMVLEGTDIPAGQTVRYLVTQVGFGIVGEEVEGQSTGGRCEVPWDQWFHPNAVRPPVTLQGGQNFPPVQFKFEAHTGGEAAISDTITYEDTFSARLIFEDGTILRNTTYTLDTPWGTRTDQTLEDGTTFVEQIPPGPVRVDFRETFLPEEVAQS